MREIKNRLVIEKYIYTFDNEKKTHTVKEGHEQRGIEYSIPRWT